MSKTPEPDAPGFVVLLGVLAQALGWVIVGMLIGWQDALLAAGVTLGIGLVFEIAKQMWKTAERKRRAAQTRALSPEQAQAFVDLLRRLDPKAR